MTGPSEVDQDASCAERGYLHLTPKGWVRCDFAPFPQDRLETWLYEMEQPAEDAKESDCLTRLWISDKVEPSVLERWRAKFGAPVPPAKERRIVLQSRV